MRSFDKAGVAAFPVIGMNAVNSIGSYLSDFFFGLFFVDSDQSLLIQPLLLLLLLLFIIIIIIISCYYIITIVIIIIVIITITIIDHNYHMMIIIRIKNIKSIEHVAWPLQLWNVSNQVPVGEIQVGKITKNLQ